MEVNKWADWSNEEWLALMLPNKARKEAEALQGKKVSCVSGSHSSPYELITCAGVQPACFVCCSCCRP